MPNLLQLQQVVKKFPVKAGLFSRTVDWVQAVRGVSLEIGPSETLGLVGESGCGKTTVARLIARLAQPDQGKIFFEGNDIGSLSEKRLKPFRREIQMIFQDPFSSLNPRMKIGEIIAEPLMIHKVVGRREKREKVGEILSQVGLSPNFYDRYPHEFSGGQRQRIGIARAVALKPRLVVADEPVSALDVLVSAQIVDLLQELQQKFQMSYLFISHDLKTIDRLSHRVAVMYLGKIVETGSKESLRRPLHPYTQALRAAVPVADPKRKRKRIVLAGEVPSPINPPPACAFHPRCPYAEKICREEEPGLKEWRQGHWAACHLVDKIHL